MSSLCQIIADQIRSQAEGRIPFTTYMDLALYHPQYGYYASNPALIGTPGDFVTAPHLTPVFGELLAVQFEQLWQILGQPTPFTLVEMGAGQGLIIQDVCRYLQRHHPDFFQALRYRVVEKSPALMQAQQYLMRSLSPPGQGLHWSLWSDIANESVVGCFFSNELVDAFPVHLLQWQQGQLYERYVALTNAGMTVSAPADIEATTQPLFQEQLGELSTPLLKDYFELVDITWSDQVYGSAYQTEVNLAALDWLSTVATKLRRGYVLTIDYGYPAHRYYSPVRRQGTLQCYFNHAHHSDPFIHVGQQDITAHVDFTALERHGQRCGLKSMGSMQQGLLLMALGLGDRLAALSHQTPSAARSINDILRDRDALHALMNPLGMGNFNVLLQAKGLTASEFDTIPQGLDIPPMAV
ncbi:MAG: class I SAM-dependent methyltransferase [Cyanothece sp. SIO2G6]|nr:class I SAM-dependent methyltransferase [Cyanothece sp. SIO2G6]